MFDLVAERASGQASWTLAVVAADIHPEGNDPEEGMLDAPTDENEHGEEGRK